MCGRERPIFLRELLVGGAEVVEQLLVGRRFLEGVELLAVQVLDQGVPEQVVVLSLLDDGADLGQPGPLGGAPPPLAHDELIAVRSGRADDHRLEQADLPDRFGELLERVLVEGPPRLPGVRRDRGDRDLLVVSAEDLDRSSRGLRRARPTPVPCGLVRPRVASPSASSGDSGMSAPSPRPSPRLC